MSTVRHETPVLHWEYHVGDFVTKRSHHVMEVGFSTRIAEKIAELALMMAGGDVRSVYLLFYPWLEGAWRERRDEGWTTAGTRVFERVTFFGRVKRRSWTLGFARDRTKLSQMIDWLWTLPGRDTFIILPNPGSDAPAALEMLEDDREDDGSNERRMIAAYRNVLSRGENGAYLRIMSTSAEEEIAQLVSRLSGPGISGVDRAE